MAKNKGAASSAVANRPAYSRVSFLYQAAALLAATRTAPDTPNQTKPTDSRSKDSNDSTGGPAVHTAPNTSDANLMGMSRRLLTQMRSVSRKTNMRLRPAVKHRVCKYCDTLLVEGSTCTSTVENESRGGRKPWADMLAVACKTCGRVRRFPVSAPRQPRRPLRGEAGEHAPTQDAAVPLEKQAQNGNKPAEQGKADRATGAKSGPG